MSSFRLLGLFQWPQEERGIHKFLLGLYNNFVAKKALTLTIGTVLLVLAGLGTSFVVIDNALVDYFKEDTEISLSDRFLREKFNGTKTFSIVLESDRKGGMNDPEALLVMDALAQELYAEHDQVKKILSYTDLLKRLNQLFHADESALGLPAKVAVADEGLADFGFGFDTEDSSEGFGFDAGDTSEGFGFEAEDNSEGFGFGSEEDFGDFGVFDSSEDDPFLVVEEDPNLPRISDREAAVLESLWQKYTAADERLVTLGSLESNFQEELAELQALNPAWAELSYDPEADAYETLLAASRLVNYDGISYYEIPADPARYGWETTEDLEGVIGNLLFLLSSGLDSWADDNLEPSKVRMMVQMNTKGNIASGAVEDTARAFLEKNLPEGYTYMVAGVAQVEIAITDLIVGAQTSSILISIIIVFLILSLYFKSPIAGLVGTVPLSVSIMINFGLMGLFRINLDMSTAMVASIAIGIGIDYTIHFMSSYHHYARQLEDHGEITRKTLLSSGKAILFNALSVGLGFGVLALSAFRPLTYMGILIGITMFTASFAAMTLLPALLGVLKPKFMKKPLLFESAED
jgi:predicted RND superfamily exporter protein